VVGVSTEWLVGAEGVRLATDRANPGAASSVLLLHGGGQTRHAWRGVHRELAAAGHEVVSLDQRGHGDSDWSPPGHYSFRDYGADLAAVARTMAGPPVFVGASLGGIASIAAIGLAGVPATGLVLVDITTRPRLDGTSRIHQFMAANPRGFADLAEAAAAITVHLPGRGSRSVEGLQRNLRRRDDGRWYWHWDQRILEHGPDRYAAEEADALDAALASVAVPTMLIWGDRSDVVTANEVEHFQRLVPHAEVARLADSHHMVTGDGNGRFGALIARFVARVAEG
jgi:pimeloyl-ACP methyl ester carboxylesterase